MENEEELLESLILGGIIGVALGAIITKDKSGTGLGAIAGAAILASFRANERAKKLNLPMLVEEDNILYQIEKDGTKKVIKEIPKSSVKIKSHFTIN